MTCKTCKQHTSVAKNVIVPLLYMHTFFLLITDVPITTQSLVWYITMQLQTHFLVPLTASYGHVPKVLIDRT